MATALPTKRRWTLKDLPDLPDDGLIYDILGGELVVRNAPNINHALALTELFMLLGRGQEAGFGEVYSSTAAAAMDYPAQGEDAEDVSHPDLMFVRQERIDLRGWQAIEGVPDLVIEILSKGTLREHRPGGHWWDAYERNGVPHYWLVDTERRTIQQFALVGEPYVRGRYGRPVVLRPGDALTSALFPAISVPVDRVFQRVRARRRQPRRRDKLV